eukprot:COSAG01_NODE_26649_length_707_cov_1.009868_2_plen_61_part_00
MIKNEHDLLLKVKKSEKYNLCDIRMALELGNSELFEIYDVGTGSLNYVTRQVRPMVEDAG